MSEIEFYAVEEEIVEVFTLLLNMNCSIVPDLQYSSDSITSTNKISEIIKVSSSTSLFFIIRDDLIESPLKLREVNTPTKHFFYLSPRMGGPCLQFYWGKIIHKNNKTSIAASWLSYYPWYEDSITREHKKVSKDLLKIYHDCSKVIRTNRNRIQPGKRMYWISPQIEHLMLNGNKLIGLEEFSIDEILNKKN
jgi:hypothetical protein